MAITIKTDEEIDLMRQSGQLLAKVHEELHAAIRPGISTLELDEIGEKTIRALGGIPNCKNYEGFPASVCISVNDEVVHGIPSADRILQEGDIVTFDALKLDVKVASDEKVEYEGRLYSLSAFTGNFLPEDMQTPSRAYQGPKYFSYNGKTLWELRLMYEGK